MIRWFKILIGTLCMAMAVNFVYEPMHMVTGGVSGTAIIIKGLSMNWSDFEIPVWMTNILLNIPIFLWGYFVRGKRYLRVTFVANLLFTLFLFCIPVIPIRQKDYFLAALYGGILNGTGLGLVFSTGYSTGGTDLLSSILHKYMPQVPIARILFCLDAAVIAAGIFTFGSHSAAYAVFAVFLSSKVMDLILTGVRAGKQIWIISEEYQKIGSQILEELHRGVTSLDGRGVYSNRKKNVLVCLASAREIARILQIVEKNDDNAFVFIQDVKEIMGEGFVKIGE
ncbi:MAG: YitT family protein [Clostridiaceae bacterium]|nr:MAG: YitT family protein [Clostridiaceae bacterium]